MRPFLTAAAAFLLLGSDVPAQFNPGDIFIANCTGSDSIYHVDPSTYQVTPWATGLGCPSGLLFRGGDRLLCANHRAPEVREYDSSGNGTVVLDSSDGLQGPFANGCLLQDLDGRIYVADFESSQILRFQPDYTGGVVFADSSDGLDSPDGLAFHPDGDLLVGSRSMGSSILEIAPDGTASVFDVLPSGSVTTIAVRPGGDVYVMCTNGSLYRYASGSPSSRSLVVALASDGYPALAFNRDGSILYLTRYDSQSLSIVDPDSGLETQVATGIQQPVSVAVVPHQASWQNYGPGFPGTQGVPSLTVSADPELGATVSFDIGNSLGAPTYGIALLGFVPASLPGSWGGDLLVIPKATYTLQLPASGGSYPVPLPEDPRLYGLILYLQVLEADPGAAKGVSNTRGLQVILGL